MPPVTPGPTDIPDESAENVPANADHPPILISDSESNSDDENCDHDGYELLSQDPDNFFDVDNDLGEEINCTSDKDEPSLEVEILNHHSLLLPPPVSEPATPEEDKNPKELNCMDEGHIETIKSVMKGITIPSSNLPHWATLVPEEEWKTALILEMKTKNHNSKLNSHHSRGLFTTKSPNSNNFESHNDLFR